VLDEVIEANCRGTWTINALTGKVGFPSLWSRDVVRWVRFGLSVAGPFVCRCLTIQTMLRFHIPLIEPDVRICRIRLSEKTHTIAVAIACDAVCNF
jgi:hypothetical protein